MKKLLMYLVILPLTVGLISCGDDEDDGGTNPVPQTDPIVGAWISTGSDIAPLLDVIFVGSGGVDTILATFTETDYTVVQINGDGTRINYAGTYTDTKSAVNDIYSITINQTAPAAATSEGIYEVYTATPDSMWYEVVLTSGTQNVPPTPAGGFGSTNGGAFGTTNVQKYIKM